MSDNGHVRCKVGIVVWGKMCGNMELGGEPGSLLLYIILRGSLVGVCVDGWDNTAH